PSGVCTDAVRVPSKGSVTKLVFLSSLSRYWAAPARIAVAIPRHTEIRRINTDDEKTLTAELNAPSSLLRKEGWGEGRMIERGIHLQEVVQKIFITFQLTIIANASISTNRSLRQMRAWMPVLAGKGSRPKAAKNSFRISLKAL